MWGCTVKEAQARCSSTEFVEWMAYDRLDPFGRERIDLGFGIVSSVLANVNRGKNTRPFKPKDFMVRFDKAGGKKKTSAKARDLQWQSFFKSFMPKGKK